MNTATLALPPAKALKLKVHWTERLAHAGMVIVALALLAFLAAPLLAILQKSIENNDGRFVGLANFIAYAQTPALLDSLWNSLWVSLLVTAIVLPTAFGFAYALTRSCKRYKGLARPLTLVPLLAPALLAAISLSSSMRETAGPGVPHFSRI